MLPRRSKSRGHICSPGHREPIHAHLLCDEVGPTSFPSVWQHPHWRFLHNTTGGWKLPAPMGPYWHLCWPGASPLCPSQYARDRIHGIREGKTPA